MGMGLINGSIEHVETVTISNYSAIANSHTLQFSTARIKSSQSAVFTSRYLVTASNVVASSVFVFTPLLAGDCLKTNSQAGGHLAPTSYSSDWLKLTNL
jgi:hypothetical protein